MLLYTENWKLNELILNANGTVIVVGDAGTVAGIITDRVREATIPAVLDGDGNEVSPAVAPDAASLAVEVSREDIKTHPWRLPKARAERLEVIRDLRNAKLIERDNEANHALTGRPNMRSVAAIEADRQTLRDLPPVAETALTDTDAIDAYQPAELA